MKYKSVWKNIILLITLLVFVTGCAPSYHGAAISPVSPAADINMTDQNGHTFQLSALRGKVVLVFFGFLNCPDECPLTMAHLSQAMKSLGNRSQDVQVVMVSTDPIRDSSQAMKDYLANFDPAFLGITGTLDQLKPIWDDWDVVVLDGGATHSDYTYVVDKSGNLVLTFDPEMTPDDIASDLNKLLSN